MILKTKRLVLRPPRKSDWKDLVEGLNEKSISDNITHIPSPYKKKDAIEWLNRKEKEWKEKKKNIYSFVIELKSEKKVIGGIRIFSIDIPNGTGATGSWINKEYRNQGYVTESKVALNDFAFNKLKLRRLSSQIIVSNKASRAVQERMGYKLEGIKRKEVKARSTGKISDSCVYGLLREDWVKRRSKIINDLRNKT